MVASLDRKIHIPKVHTIICLKFEEIEYLWIVSCNYVTQAQLPV